MAREWKEHCTKLQKFVFY